MPDIVVRGCHLDSDFPQECVLDYHRAELCLHADGVVRREQCRWWREAEAADQAADQPTPGTARS